ncbi:MAG: CD225/dispanin family protein [Planctomycetaceae bacterium]|nr:CD225/dispanin family protein [Planctomycetaceae bacterium]
MSTGNPYQASSAPMGMMPKVPNYLVQSILVTFCCCLPFGIVAIVYAAQVNGMLAGGNLAGAMKASNSAKMWCWIGFGLGLLFQLGYVALMVLGGAAGMMQPQVQP